jgi:hypothetical protein
VARNLAEIIPYAEVLPPFDTHSRLCVAAKVWDYILYFIFSIKD